jgi:biopolymer transport protein ExbD
MAHKPTQKNVKIKKKKKSSLVKLNITSMMDMFTIILVFLMKSFSAEGTIVTPAKGLTLPTSNIEKGAKKSLDVSVGAGMILLDDQPVVATAEVLNKIKQDPANFTIDALYTKMDEQAMHGRDMEAKYGTPFSGEVFVQIDQTIPFEVLTRVMYTCGQSGFSNMRLAVFKKE